MEMINNSSSSQTFVFIFFIIIIIIIIFSLNQYVVAAHTLRLNMSSPSMAMYGSHVASNLLDEKSSSDETYVGGVDAYWRRHPPLALAAATEEVNIPSQKDKDKDSGAGTNHYSHFSSYPSTESECVITGNSIDDCWRCDPNQRIWDIEAFLFQKIGGQYHMQTQKASIIKCWSFYTQHPPQSCIALYTNACLNIEDIQTLNPFEHSFMYHFYVCKRKCQYDVPTYIHRHSHYVEKIN